MENGINVFNQKGGKIFLVTLNNYGGYSASRYLKAEISYSSGTSLSWKMTVMSGSSEFYSTGPTTLYINDKLVSETARLYASNYNGTSKKAFPVGPAGQYIEGTYDVGTYGNIPISFSTAIYNTTQETQTGSIDIYKISYNANGGSGTNPGTHYTSSGITTAIKSNTFTKAGYNFAGWTTNSNGTSDGNGWTNWSGSWGNWNGTYGISNYALTLYARWTPKTPTITYKANGGSGADYTQTITYGQQWTAATSNTTGFTRTGYTLSKWNSKADGTGEDSCTPGLGQNWWKGGNDFTLYAQWTPNKIKLTLNPNGGTGGTQNIWYYYGTSTFYSNEACTTKITSITRPTRTGYTFVHYYGDGTSGGTNGERYIAYDGIEFASDLATDIYKNATLYAQWSINSYTNTIYHYQYFGPNNNGANANGWKLKETSTFTAKYGDTVTVPSSQVKSYSGYRNSGTAGSSFFAASGATWGTKVIGTGTFIQPTSGVTMEYYYYPLYYIDLNLNVNGSIVAENSSIMTADIYINNSRVGNDVADYWTQHPSKTTYSVQDVKIGSNYVLLNVTGSSGTIELSDLVCTVYVGQKYTVTYKSNYSGGSADQTQAINYGTAWTTKSSSTFTRTGYTFSGWNTAANGSGDSYTASTSQSNTTASNITLYAQWTVNTGSLFFNANYNSVEQNLLDFTKFTNGTQNNINYSYDATTGILTLNGTSNNGQIQTICWLDCNIPTNTYYTISGEVISGSMENGRFVVEMPVASGAERQKLDLFNTNYGVSYLSSTTINSIRLWAWQNGNSGILKFNNYKIKLKIEFGIHYEDFIWTPNKKTVSYNSSYGSLVNITRPGYKFNGWYTAASGGTQVTSSTIQTSTGNTILYAQWTPYKITINYFANGATYGTYYGNELDLTKQIHTQTFTYDVQNSNGLNNINNKDSLYLEKLGYRPVPNKQWNTKSDGTGININHNTGYNGQTLAAHLGLSIDAGNVSQNVYANWEPWGVVKIYTDNGWKLAVPYIYDNGWKQTFPYIYDNGWKECH